MQLINNSLIVNADNYERLLATSRCRDSLHNYVVIPLNRLCDQTMSAAEALHHAITISFLHNPIIKSTK